MPPTLHFRSYRSNSAGNCLALWTDETCLLFDCGLATLRECRDVVRRHNRLFGGIGALVVSHAHRDHLSAQALRVFGEEDVPIRCHRKVLAHVRTRHGLESGAEANVRGFGDEGLTVGDFRVTPIELAHAPEVPTFGFVVRARIGATSPTVVVATDFWDPSDLLPSLRGADFVFVEANHDLELLRKRYNYASQWHMSNAKTARLLADAFGRGGRAPASVVLGHLSEDRNEDCLALREVRQAFAREGARLAFELETAPKYEASRTIRLA